MKINKISEDITEEELETIVSVASRIRSMAPPIDPHTENFVIGEEYAHVSDMAKITYLLTALGHVITVARLKKNAPAYANAAESKEVLRPREKMSKLSQRRK